MTAVIPRKWVSSEADSIVSTITGAPPIRARLPTLPQHRDCTSCELSDAGCRSPGIAGHLWSRCIHGDTDTAVLIVGEAPGGQEDDTGLNFQGPSGEKLRSFYCVEGLLDTYADVWATNAVRCRPPANADPSIGQMRTCRPYLLTEIRKLSATYRRLIILCVGGRAIKTLHGCTLDGHFRHQGCTSNDLSSNVTLWATYHPAYILPHREPARERTVYHHLRAVAEFLATGTLKKEALPRIQVAPWPPPRRRGPLAFDTETYGIQKGPNAHGGPCLKCFGTPPPGDKPCPRCHNEGFAQNVFHPRRMMATDGVARTDLVVCATISWRDEDLPTRPIHVGYFNTSKKMHVKRFLAWLQWASEIWGQNLAFDLKLVREVFGKAAVPAWTSLVELMVRTFLYDDLMAERALKAVGPMFRISGYDIDEKPVKMVEDIDGAMKYACQDAWTTYRCVEVADGYIHDRFARHPNARMKLAKHTYGWFSDQVWTAVLMEETGVCFDRAKLEKLHVELSADLDRVLAIAETDYTVEITRTKKRMKDKKPVIEEWREEVPLKLAGDDSQKCINSLVYRARATALRRTRVMHGESSPEYARCEAVLSHMETTKTQQLSAGRNNRNLLLGVLPRNDPNPESGRDAAALALSTEAAGIKKILTSYTGSLLFGRPAGETWEYDEVPTKSKTAKNPTRKVKRPGTNRTLYDTSGALIQDASGNWIAYPSWYIVPKSTDEAGASGGVRQYRWAAKSPPLQTLPPVMKPTLASRWNPGVLHSYDLAQIEWRVNMYLANDRRGLREIADNVDIHSRSASYLLGWNIDADKELRAWINCEDGHQTLLSAPDITMRKAAQVAYREAPDCPDRHPDGYGTFLIRVRKWLRQNSGKSQNFAESYGGGGAVVVATTRIKSGIEIPEARGYEFVDYMAALYPERAEYRLWLVEQVIRDGALHLPILGQSRSFGGDEEAIRGKYRPQILDFPIQTTASNIIQGAIAETQQEFTKRKMRSRVNINTHDAMTIDSPAREYLVARRIAQDHIVNNWYLRELVKENDGRPFPLEYESAGENYRGCKTEDFLA